MKIWLDGKMVDEKKADVPLLTHSLHYGSAVFEGIRFYKTEQGPAVFRLRDHIDRLFYSGNAIDLKFAHKKSEVEKAVLDVIRANKLTSGYVRPIGFFGTKMGLDPKTAPMHLAVAAWPWGKYLGDKVKVKISKTMRIHPSSVDVNAKISGYYANSILATQEVRSENFDEALLLDHRGFIAEGPAENIFFIKGRNLYTPKKGSILPGITRDSVMKIARDLGLRVVEKDIKPRDIKTFDEAFFTGTAAEVSLIGSIGKTKFKSFEISQLISTTYQKVVHGEEKKYKNWVTHV